ncbi:MAG: Gfo/Idh/MocA family oxidoreductase [Ilumatobacter sp.]|nr:Gfo/Idh/MocA family oxidoreductase [Ilumatobacter sp.]
MRYGVIGTGMMGIEHIENIRAMDGCEVAAVADPHQPSLDRARAVVGGDVPLATFTTVEELLDAGLCDAVVVASPNFTHHEVLVPAIESGMHLLIEKPLCTTMEDCRDIVDRVAARPPGQVVWMGLEYRYMPPVRRLLEEVRAGVVGDVKMVAVREHRFPFLEKVGDWNRFNRNTGGTLVEKTCHFFDLMLQITQSRPVRVFASGNQDVNHLDERYDGETPDILDNAFVVVDFADGSRGLLDLCMFAEASKNEREISVVGPLGKVEALDTESVLRVGRRTPDIFSGVHAVVEETIYDGDIKHVGLHHGASYLEHVDFAAAIRAGEPAAVTVLDGLWAAAIGFAAHRSLDTGDPVQMSDLAELDGLESSG